MTLYRSHFLLLILLAALQMLLVIQWVNQQGHFGTARLLRTAAALLADAQQTQDDLAKEKIVRAVVQGAGVHWAAVLDTSGHVMAHSDPSRIGEVWRTRRDGLPLGTPVWGMLQIQISHRPAADAVRSEALFLLMAAALALGWIQLREKSWKRHLRAAEAASAEIRLQWTDEAKRSENLAATLESTKKAQSQALCAVLEELRGPALWLDGEQRIAAWNSAFEKICPGDWRGRSWLEAPLLTGVDLALEQSLQEPGQPVVSKTLVIQSWPGGGTLIRSEL